MKKVNKSFESFLVLPEGERRDAIEAVAISLSTLAIHVEKDFWVCLVLDMLYNRLPGGHPKLLFKGGTCLSKVFGLIQRFSEDVDIVVHRDDLGFKDDRDPTAADNLSNKKRKILFEELRAACSDYVLGDLKAALADLIDDTAEGCRVYPDDKDVSRQTLYVDYPSLFPGDDNGYVVPRVKIEAGARSALTPSLAGSASPYISAELPDWSFEVENIRAIAPERTYLEKLLILHGLHCGYRDAGRLPSDRDRISRHYYDAATVAASEVGRSAMSDVGLLRDVRNHNLVAFRQAWKRFEEAVPGSVRLVPQPELRAVIERDYETMRSMIFNEPPNIEWIMEQLRSAEAVVNGPSDR